MQITADQLLIILAHKDLEIIKYREYVQGLEAEIAELKSRKRKPEA